MRVRAPWTTTLPVTLAGILAGLLFWASGASPQERLTIFDAHLHYNQEPAPFYSLDQVREVFRSALWPPAGRTRARTSSLMPNGPS
jgi:hypothetical protein